VISHALWQRRFSGSADVLGATITVAQQPYTIIGVTPPTFRGILVGWTLFGLASGIGLAVGWLIWG